MKEFMGASMFRYRSLAAAVVTVLVLTVLSAGPTAAQAYSPAYDTTITGTAISADGTAISGIDVIVFLEADGSSSWTNEDPVQRSKTNADGRFSFYADSHTVYKVRLMDYGSAVRHPQTYVEQWYGGLSTFNFKLGYDSAKQIIIPEPGVVDLGMITLSLADLPPFTINSNPSITGNLEYGQDLFIFPGEWSPEPAFGYSNYAWFRGTTKVGSRQSRRVSLLDIGQSLHAVVGAYDWGKLAYTEAESDPVSIARVTLPDSGVTIAGQTRVGEQLTVSYFAPNWTATDLALISAPQWYRDGIAIPAATSLNYYLTPEDEGTVVSFKAGGGIVHSEVPTAVIAAGTLTTVLPTITGTKKVGYTLTANPGAWGPATVTMKYQWYRLGVLITGATAKTYKQTGADAGKKLTVRATGSKTGYKTAFRTSYSTTVVANGTLTTATPTITGTKKVGYTLTANPGTWGPATVTLKYQWYRSGVAISGGTAKTYKLVSADRYDTIKVRVLGTKTGYTSVAKYSASTVKIP